VAGGRLLFGAATLKINSNNQRLNTMAKVEKKAKAPEKKAPAKAPAKAVEKLKDLKVKKDVKGGGCGCMGMSQAGVKAR
jgi:hypothetical protein